MSFHLFFFQMRSFQFSPFRSVWSEATNITVVGLVPPGEVKNVQVTITNFTIIHDKEEPLLLPNGRVTWRPLSLASYKDERVMLDRYEVKVNENPFTVKVNYA